MWLGCRQTDHPSSSDINDLFTDLDLPAKVTAMTWAWWSAYCKSMTWPCSRNSHPMMGSGLVRGHTVELGDDKWQDRGGEKNIDIFYRTYIFWGKNRGNDMEKIKLISMWECKYRSEVIMSLNNNFQRFVSNGGLAHLIPAVTKRQRTKTKHVLYI